MISCLNFNYFKPLLLFQVTRVQLQQATCSQTPGPARGSSGLDLSVFHWDQVCHSKALKVQHYRDIRMKS